MLYFGLPVEPILSELTRFSKPDFDVDDWDELCTAEVRPPLHFLTAYDQRNFGYDYMRGKEDQYSTIPVAASQMPDATGEGLSLRGGGDDDDALMADVDYPPDNGEEDSLGPSQTAMVMDNEDDNSLGDGSSSEIVTMPVTGILNKVISGRGTATPDSRRRQNQSAITSKIGHPSPESDKVHGWVPLFGFQGRIMFDTDDMSTFQAAARKLLSLRQREQSDIVLVEFDFKTAKVLRRFDDNIPLNPVSDLAEHLGQATKSASSSAWFVLRRGEDIPSEWEPPESFFLTTLIKLTYVDDDGRENLSYLKVPDGKSFFGPKQKGYIYPANKPWGSNQYMPFITTAQEVLVGRPDQPGGSRCDLIISRDDEDPEGSSPPWYGGLEIHRELWDSMHPLISKGQAFRVKTRPVANDTVVFYLPGNSNNARTLKNRECLRRTGSGDPYPDALHKVGLMTKSVRMPMKASHYLIWRGVDYFNQLISRPVGAYSPVRWNYRDKTSSEQAQKALSKLIARSVDDKNEPCQFFVIQPMDGAEDPCTIEAVEGLTGQAEFSMEPLTMKALKTTMEMLYAGDEEITYDAEKDSVVMEPLFDEETIGRSWSPASFVLRPDATDSEASMARRFILTQMVRADVLQDDELDFVKTLAKAAEANNHWGPRYGEVAPFRKELSLPAIVPPGKLHPVVFHEPKTPPPAPRKSAHPMPREPDQTPREGSYVRQPSIFDMGVWNPSFPINAPPVEAILRTGAGRVPMVTKNVLTPSEQRELQNKVWSLSKVNLARLAACPYQKCRFTYRQDEDETLLVHLEKTHAEEKCPWCDIQLFKHWSYKQKEEHYRNSHADQLRKVLQLPERPKSHPPQNQTTSLEKLRNSPSEAITSLSTFRITDQARPPVGPLPQPEQPAKASDREKVYRYCDRCGRDHKELKTYEDRKHHDRVCVPLAEGAGRCTFCKLCGDRVWKTEKDATDFGPFDTYPHKCHGTLHENKPHCTKCGFSMKKLSDEKVDRHRKFCGGFFGTLGCFCPYCQKSFVSDGTQKPIDEIKNHITACPQEEGIKPTPWDIYSEVFWRDTDKSIDPLFVGAAETSAALCKQQRRPRASSRYLSLPLMWHDKPGPIPTSDPPSECPAAGCREPLFGLMPSEVLGHFEKKHFEEPLKQCPLCHLSFKRPKEDREKQPELGEWEDRKDQVSHMECHVYQLWDILAGSTRPPAMVNQEPFNPGHSLWDPENESALDRRDKRCPHFDQCGAMVGFMNQLQWNEHLKKAHAIEPLEAQIVRDMDAEIAAAREERRQQRIREGKNPIPGLPAPKNIQDSGSGPDVTGETQTGTGPSVQLSEDDEDDPESQDVRQDVLGPKDSTARGPKPESKVHEGHRGSRPHGPGPILSPPPTGSKPHTATALGKRPRQGEKQPKSPKGPIKNPPKDSEKVTTDPNSVKGTPQTGGNPPTAKFVPADDMYCSRCLRPIPKSNTNGEPSKQVQIDAHSDPRRSCRIPARQGKVQFDREDKAILPSKVGWITQKEIVKAGGVTKLRKAFVKNNPGLKMTIYPTDNRFTDMRNLWTRDPNHPKNKDNWGLRFRPRNDDETDESEDDGLRNYHPENDEPGDDDEDEEEDEGVEKIADADGEDNDDDVEEDDDDDGGPGNRAKQKRKPYRGFSTHDPTYRDRGEEDDLSQTSDRELVPESGDDGAGTFGGSSGAKRKRGTGESSGQGNKGGKDKTQERHPKKAKVDASSQGDDRVGERGDEREPQHPRRRKGPATVSTLLASGGLLSLFVGLSEPFHVPTQDEVDVSDPDPSTDDRDPSIPRFRLSEIRKHDAKSGSPWVTQGDKVYDITDWVAAHPGGDVILRAAGGSIDPYWNIFTIHKSPHVYEILQQYLIGFIESDDLVDGKPAAQEIEDPFKHDPTRDERLITLTPKPRNAETPVEGLADSYLTPNELFYVRNHMWVPQVDDTSDYTLKIELLDGTIKEYSLDDLKTKFKPTTVVAVLQCSGNRRSDMTRNAKKTNGLQWNVGAISCAEWQGVKLTDVLADAGIPILEAMTGDTEAKHVQFMALEAYGASIPIESALDPRGDVLLAYSMNGKPLPRDHGYPLRALVPGHVAARSVKWLSQITISDEESHSQWQRKDYKCFGPNETSPDWDRAAPIQEMPITSAITTVRLGDWKATTNESSANEDTGSVREASLMGYAYSGGGRRIVRVDVSVDNGKTWDQAELLDEPGAPPKTGHKSWAWKRWRYDGAIPLGEPGEGTKKCTTLLVKATDEAYNSQPESYAAIYNQRGNLANAWHRLKVCSECANKAVVVAK
ncbi:hypothetical protein CTAM01_06614 [Colletotrichum tamarilloi]|uniref:Nitrate reductase [NADPH] n=1 Tax=Colletotrichum tamarilloi TaxID=1209934 RepID=A0ABQ9RBW2_9PEZI|nr:uncharacterized protein CTAM01_06614 [Colletotrichum tamarilloi]KAK1500679.1 hypothetical protein CTAM01_06614 [Colletotrichum tamarilloi]